jgi:glycosyltransferase involved in cell wall biosynthesis
MERVSKIVGFPQKHLCERGTTVALYDYAVANEEVCGNVSIVFYQPSHPYNSPGVVDKFKKRFTVVPYENWSDIEGYITELSIDYLYIIKYGNRDGCISSKVPCLVHAVFSWDPHGNYATVSRSLAEKHNGKWLPHIVNPLPFSPNESGASGARKMFRESYGIPDEAYVYGRYGGKDTFSIEYVKEVIRGDIDKHPNVWFVFVNTDKFISHPRVLFLPTITDPLEKGNYINACDAMIHGRVEGETFGLAVAEFISAGKPVLSCRAQTTNDNEHILLGKEWVYEYRNREEFQKMVWATPIPIPSTSNPYEEYSPRNVMRIFGEIIGDRESFTAAST